MDTLYRRKWKICLVGDREVGKTSLIRRYVLDEFDDSYLTTLGTKVSKKSVTVSVPPENVAVQADLAIWDIMGQPQFRELMKEAYFSGAHGILAVADLTMRSSLDALPSWIRSVESVAGDVPIVLAANKSDLADQAAFGIPEIERLAGAYRCPYRITSAKTGENVEELFRLLGEVLADPPVRVARIR